MAIQVKRVYEPAAKADGKRYLVDRVWPRGIKKDTISIEAWLKELGPSTELRKWFSHEPTRWTEFKKRYFNELASKKELWEPLREASCKRPSPSFTAPGTKRTTRQSRSVSSSSRGDSPTTRFF